MSDLVERLRADARRDRVTVYSAKEIAEIADRIAHLERVVAAADELRGTLDCGDYETCIASTCVACRA